jgi:hypothetical protein
MRESDYFNESDIRKPTRLNCPFCGQTFRYDVRWRQRLKKKSLPGAASSEDRRRFSKARSYLVRIDDTVGCQNGRCRRRFEIASFQTVVFLSETGDSSDGNREQLKRTRPRRNPNRNHR